MASLITGGSGVIGSELAHLLVEKGEDVVLFSRTMNPARIKNIMSKVKCVKGDLGIHSHVYNVIKENNITEIYHLGAILTVASEQDRYVSFNSNVIGTANILEAARIFGVRKIVFSSSIGTYGLETGETVTDVTIQRPTMFYGIGKLYCEGLGGYYRGKFGVDFRSIRYPAVVGPGIKTPGHWIPPMIEDAVSGRKHVSRVSENTSMWMISLRDAAKAAYLSMKAPKNKIKMINYNVTGCMAALKGREIASAIKEYIPEAVIDFNKKMDTSQWGVSGHLDDSRAREEWGWKPDHDSVKLIVKTFIDDMKSNPERFGL